MIIVLFEIWDDKLGNDRQSISKEIKIGIWGEKTGKKEINKKWNM